MEKEYMYFSNSYLEMERWPDLQGFLVEWYDEWGRRINISRREKIQRRI